MKFLDINPNFGQVLRLTHNYMQSCTVCNMFVKVYLCKLQRIRITKLFTVRIRIAHVLYLMKH